MIKSIEFTNYRNLNRKFEFDNNINIIFGNNNSGKTNLLDGIRLAFSTITNDYYKINKSDFNNSDDSIPINIKVALVANSIPSLNYLNEKAESECGFSVLIKKSQNGRYIKEISLFNGSPVDYEILINDMNLPNVFMIPLARIEDIYTDGLITGISKFIDSEEKYKTLKQDSKNAIQAQIESKKTEFQNFCKKFNQELDIQLSDPKMSDEKVYIVDGDKEHNYRIGSGYKSIANIILNTLNENYNIILIDEIENHLHPSLVRTLIRELRNVKNTMIIGTTHSPVVINELDIEELTYITGEKLSSISDKNKNKLNIFLHPGRSELMLANNVILVEGYTEELLLNNYLHTKNYNWTVINVAGIMFAPYIELSVLLNKRVIVISDNDKSLSDDLKNSERFNNLSNLCLENNIKLLEVDNTLETDLYNNGFLNNFDELLKPHEKHSEIKIAKKNRKTEIAEKLIEDKVDLSEWHIIKDIINEFKGN